VPRLGVPVAVAVLLATTEARATNILEFPDNGSEQMGRGGAWIARASDPLATFYNPAGLAGQPTRLTLQANVALRNACMTRVKAANDTTQNDGATPGGTYPQVCADVTPNVLPQLGFTYHLTDRVGVGLLLVSPSSAGNTSWPEFINTANGPIASPQRYLLLSSSAVILTPSIGVGAEVLDGLRLGASFEWGLAPKLDFTTAAMALNSDGQDPQSNDLKAEFTAGQAFIPGVTLGALYSPAPILDVAAWYKWSAPIDTKGDVKTYAKYFTPDVANGNTSGVRSGDTSLPNCGVPNAQDVCGGGNNASFRIPIPMEAKLGVRYHQPRGVPAPHLRDPISQDVYDVELDLTWANNSAFDYVTLRFPGDQNGNGIIPVNGVSGGTIPPDGDIRHHFRDVFGVRLGGDYVVLPDVLSLRAGGFVETRGQDPTYQNLDFAGAERFGLALGGTYRLWGKLELSAGYGHVFFGTLGNSDPNAPGLSGLTGTPCNDPTGAAPPPGPACASGAPKYRTNWAVNLGNITNAINVINVGASYRF
jgi:long-subunit fatty acid transport protein